MTSYQELFDRQMAAFVSGIRRTLERKSDQLERMDRMLTKTETAFHESMKSDFKTASQEYLFETYACLGGGGVPEGPAPTVDGSRRGSLPKPLAATGHKGIVYHDPYGR